MTSFRLRPALNDSEATAGFTLLEAVIATALMAMILAALATVTRQWLPNWNRGIVRVQGTEQVALGLERLGADLAAAEFISSASDNRPAFDGTDRSITFVRTALGPNTGPGLDLVRIAEMNTGNGLQVLRTRAPFIPNAFGNARLQQGSYDPVVLLRMPYRVAFAYAGPSRMWQPTWRSQTELPAAVKVTIVNTARPDAPLLTAAIPVHARLPVECVVAKSPADCLAARSQPRRAGEAGKSAL